MYLKKESNKYPKFYKLIVAISVYLVFGIYAPAIYRLFTYNTNLKQVEIIDEYGKQISNAVIILEYNTVYGLIADSSVAKYHVDICETNANGTVEIAKRTKPFPIVLAPLFIKKYHGIFVVVFKDGYEIAKKYVTTSDNRISITMKKNKYNAKCTNILNTIGLYVFSSNIDEFIDRRQYLLLRSQLKNITEIYKNSYDRDCLNELTIFNNNLTIFDGKMGVHE